MANFLGTVSFLATAAAPMETGGIYSPDLFSLLAVPVFVLVIGTRRLAFFWSVITVLTFFAFFIAEVMGLANFKAQVVNNSAVYCLQGVLTITVIVLFLVMRNEKLRLELLEELKKTNKEVSEKQKEILDSIHYAKRIQTALLPNEKYIDRILRSLKKIN